MTMRCTIEDTLAVGGLCPGARCAFWDAGGDECVFHSTGEEIRANPALAAYLLELRLVMKPQHAPNRKEQR